MKTPTELAQEGRVVEAFDSILDQEVPISTLALPPEELAKRGLVKEAYEQILAAGPKDQGRLAFWRVHNALKKMALKPSESKTKGGILGPYPYVAVFEAESFDRPAAEKKLKAFTRKHKAWSYDIKIGKPSTVSVTFKPVEGKRVAARDAYTEARSALQKAKSATFEHLEAMTRAHDDSDDGLGGIKSNREYKNHQDMAAELDKALGIMEKVIRLSKFSR